MVGSCGVFEHVFAVVVAEAVQGLRWRESLQFGEGEDLAGAVVLAGFVEQVAVAEFGRGEVIQRVDYGDGVGEGDGFGGVVQALQESGQFQDRLQWFREMKKAAKGRLCYNVRA